MSEPTPEQKTSTLVVQPRFSMLFCLYLSIAFSGAIACLYLSEMPFWLRMLLSVTLMMAYIYYSRQYLFLKNQNSLVYLLFDTASVSELHFVNGRRFTGKLLANSFINQYLMILRFRIVENNKLYKLILFYDSESQRCLRELRRRITMSSLLDQK